MVFCIERFSSLLCLFYSTNQVTSDLYPGCSDLTDADYDIMFELHTLYREEFDIILDKIFKSQKFRCSEFHMKVILSCCVKLSSTPSYFHFMVVSALISDTIFNLFTGLEIKCFLFAKIASLCLRAVYDRCYKNFFQENEILESLDSFCERINTLYLTEDDGDLSQLVNQLKIGPLITSLHDVDVENFELTDREVEMREDIVYSITPDEMREDIATLCSMSGEPPSSSDDESDIEEEMKALNIGTASERSLLLNSVCGMCGGKCGKLLY